MTHLILVPTNDVDDVSGFGIREPFDLVEIKTTEAESKQRKRKQNRKKRKPSDPSDSDSYSDSDSVELRLPNAITFFWFPLERKAPYASDCASDNVANGNQP